VIARNVLGRTLALSLSFALSQAAVPVAASSSHVVDPSQVVNRLLDHAKSREEKVRLFQAALATPQAQQQAKALGLSAEKLRASVPHLTDAELADLTTRAARAKDVAAGHSDEDALVILGIVLLVAGLVVLVAVAGNDGYYDDCYCY
jgi:hypothetical protein